MLEGGKLSISTFAGNKMRMHKNVKLSHWSWDISMKCHLQSILYDCILESFHQNLIWKSVWGNWNCVHNCSDSRAAGGCKLHHGKPACLNKCIETTKSRQNQKKKHPVVFIPDREFLLLPAGTYEYCKYLSYKLQFAITELMIWLKTTSTY